jgi:hypothetical protein
MNATLTPPNDRDTADLIERAWELGVQAASFDARHTGTSPCPCDADSLQGRWWARGREHWQAPDISTRKFSPRHP